MSGQTLGATIGAIVLLLISATYLSPRAMVIGLHNLLDGICASSRSGALGGLGVAAPFLITVGQLAAMRTDG